MSDRPGISVFGARDNNRTITVNDGKWSDSSTFTLTVGGVLVSQAADAAVRDVGGPSEQTATTTVLGSGGSAPLAPFCEAQLPGTPARTGQRPVSSPARDGEQTGEAE
jgi:hypothetical protein